METKKRSVEVDEGDPMPLYKCHPEGHDDPAWHTHMRCVPLVDFRSGYVPTLRRAELETLVLLFEQEMASVGPDRPY